ncbi:hypothetical protein ABIB80_007295, partial [Bradyrhizobium sp. i1.15.2]|uniref:hypothetical protein n=1 Tax=Bradyrhizobium sp. i1.15.2 TaxID=3156362 RepID=UPI0033927CF9
MSFWRAILFLHTDAGEFQGSSADFLSIFWTPGMRSIERLDWVRRCRADSDEVAQAYRYEVARGFRDDVAHLSDLISPSGEAFWPAGSLASVKPRGQSGIATSTCFSS